MTIQIKHTKQIQIGSTNSNVGLLHTNIHKFY
jgi:hypothetical protein